MAQHESAKKRIRRNERARLRNRRYLSAVRTAVKKFRVAVQGSEAGAVKVEDLRPLFNKAQSLLGKAGTKGVLHPKNVSRKISRLANLLKKIESGAKPMTEAADKKKTVKKKTATTTTATAKKKSGTPAKKKASTKRSK